MLTSDPQDLVIVGAGESAEIAYEYFTHDSPHRVVAFAVEPAFLKDDHLFGLPVLPMDEMVRRYPPHHYRAHVAISSTYLNRLRRRLFEETRALGYRCLSYVSSRAFAWHNVTLGENTFVFEQNVLQHHVSVGDNVVLWSGNHVGHRTRIEDHVFMSSHVVVSGFCTVGAGSFLGVNACVADRVTIAPDNVIGMGSVVVRDTEPGRVYVGNPAKPMEKSSLDAFSVPGSLR